ncbi:MAG TPA: hypothetical protein VFU47_16785, partial [Armatimonadota bacterium]|nr:hypothetical protein [Armatimonadota bacterium]
MKRLFEHGFALVVLVLLIGARPAAAQTVQVQFDILNSGPDPGSVSVGPITSSSFRLDPCPAGQVRQLTFTLSGTLTDAGRDGVSLAPFGQAGVLRLVAGTKEIVLGTAQTSGPGPGTFPYPPSGSFSGT